MANETELIAAARAGNQDAFAQLVEANQGRIYNLTLRMTGNPEDAADVTQEAFLSAWRALPNFQGESSFATWMYRLASNATIDFLRREKRRREHTPSVSIDAESEGQKLEISDIRYSPEASLERAELRAAIERGLSELSDAHRAVLILRELEGLSYQEIARTLDLEEGTVKSRIARARLELRKLLLSYGNFLPSVSSKKYSDGEGGERDA